MRQPISALTSNLMWTRSGQVWATWRITPQRYGLRPVDEKRGVALLHRYLMRSLGGEAMLMGLGVEEDPMSVVQRQVKGINLEACPRWAQEAHATLEVLEDLPMGSRSCWLSIPLETARSAQVSASLNQLRETIGLPAARPSSKDVERYQRLADEVERLIPVAFRPRGAHPAEHVWIYAHAMRRGMVDNPPEDDLERSMLVSKSGAAVPEPLLDEGARTDEAGGKVEAMRSRVLKVTDPRSEDLGQQPSYQCMLALADVPSEGLTFPGSEILSLPDQVGIETDWVIRTRVTDRAEVVKRNRRAMNQILDQYDQRSDDEARGTDEVDSAGELLQEYRRVLNDDRLEVEIEHVLLLAVGDVEKDTAIDKAKTLIKAFNDSDCKLERPLGGQEALWWAMLPGCPLPRVAHAYRQFTTSAAFGMLVPFTSSRLGGDRGSVFALNTATARPNVVHLDLGGAPELDKSGSIAFVGELGAGKSFAMKKCVIDLLDQGGQAFCIDKSADGEWARVASAFEDHIVVDPSDPHWSMDPLAVFSGQRAAATAHALLVALLGFTPASPEGRVLSQVLAEGYLDRHGLGRLAEVVDHLRGLGDPGAAKVVAAIEPLTELTAGRVLFDPSLPPVDGTVSMVVWRTHVMDLPSNKEVEITHLFDRLSPQKVFSRAYYQVLTAAARFWSFEDRSRPAAFVLDEASDICSNEENLQHITMTVRQGRRPKALAFLGSHNPEEDFGPGTLRHLIPTRVAMRQTDETLARASVRFLGLDEDDPAFEQMVDDLRYNTSPVEGDTGVRPERRGEGFMRDMFGTVESMKVLAPASPERAQLVGTTPPKSVSSL